MKNILFRKFLYFTFVILFIQICITPSIGKNILLINNKEIESEVENIDNDVKIDLEDDSHVISLIDPPCLIPKWTYDPLGDHTYGSITLEDIDEDGYLEIMFSSGFDVFEEAPGWTYVLRYNGEIKQGWPIQTDSEPWHVPVTADIDPDFQGLEVITTSQIPGTFLEYSYAWHSDGTTVPGWPIKGGARKASPAIGDIDSDGLPEIIHPTDSGYNADRGLHVRNGDGSEVSGWPVLDDDWEEFSTPAIADVDNTGDLEIIISYGSEIYIFHNNGTVVTGWPKDGSISGVGPVLADTDGDGDLEIFMTSGHDICAFHHTGEFVDGWPVTIDFAAYYSIVLGDIDSDGETDIIVHSGNKIYIWNSNGITLSGWPVTVDNICCILHPPILGDIDGDETIEVLVTNNDGLDAYHHNGERVEGFPISYSKPEHTTLGSPALGDIDADGKLELIAVVEGDVMAWDCEGSNVEWPMFQYNPWNTGLYASTPSKPTITGPNSGKIGEKQEYIFSAIDPNSDDLYYYIEWGDGQYEEWIGPFVSGESIKLNHTWDKKGNFEIRAKAKNTQDIEGPWGVLKVTMPKNQRVFPLQWLEFFPIIQLIINFFKGFIK
jgi:hypothetical protein